MNPAHTWGRLLVCAGLQSRLRGTSVPPGNPERYRAPLVVGLHYSSLVIDGVEISGLGVDPYDVKYVLPV